jgi:hypothetical protein
MEEGRVNPIDISLSEWEGFLKSSFWNSILFEIEERDKVLMDLLRYGDIEKKWSDNEIRARINELEYLKSLPDVIIMDIKITEEGEKEKEEREEK